METMVRFLGNSACIPDTGNDSPCMLVNDDLLIDTGWYPLEGLARCGADPTAVKTLLFTHLHHDHFMALPQLLFRILMREPERMGEFTVAGPEEDVGRFTARALDFLEAERFFPERGFPAVVPLKPGMTVSHGRYVFETAVSRHPVAGLLYRVTDTATGKVLCLTGDTSYFPGQADFFRGGDAIVAETAMGITREHGDRWGHSGVYDACAVADEARIPRMFCIHQTEAELRETVRAAAELRRTPFTAEYPELYIPYIL